MALLGSVASADLSMMLTITGYRAIVSCGIPATLVSCFAENREKQQE